MALTGIVKQFRSLLAGRSSKKMRAVSPGSEDRLGVITSELEPEFVARALRKAEKGDLGELQECYMKLALDPHVKACLNSVKLALSAYPIRVSVAKSKSDAAYKAAEMIEQVFGAPRLKTRKMIRSMAMVHFTGVRIYRNQYEITEHSDGSPMLFLSSKKLVPPTRYLMSMEHEAEDYGQLRIKTRDEPRGLRLDGFQEGALSVLGDGEEDAFYDLGGVGRTILFWYCAKHFNARWWSEFNETYGEPIRIGYYEPYSEEDDRDALQEFLEQLRRAAWAMFPADQEIELMQPEVAGQVKTHEDIISLANNEMSRAIVGQIGTTGREKYGSYGETTVLSKELYKIITGVEGLIRESLREDVRFLCRANIDPEFQDADLPRVYIVIPNPEEKEQKANIFQAALDMGLTIPVQFARDELGIPEPDEDEEVLERPEQLDRVQGRPGPNGAGQPSSETNASDE